MNDVNMTPVTVSTGQQPAIADLEERLVREYPDMLRLNADEIALQLGNRRCMNMVLAGALSTVTPFAPELWIDAIKDRLASKAKLIDLNVRAFEAGRAAVAR